MCNYVQKLYARRASCRHPIYPYHLTATYAVRYLTLKANRIDFQTHVNVPWYLFTRTHSALVVVYFTTSSSPSHIPQPNWYEIVSVFLCAYRIEETIRKQANARGVRVRFCFLEFANQIQALYVLVVVDDKSVRCRWWCVKANVRVCSRISVVKLYYYKYNRKFFDYSNFVSIILESWNEKTISAIYCCLRCVLYAIENKMVDFFL